MAGTKQWFQVITVHHGRRYMHCTEAGSRLGLGVMKMQEGLLFPSFHQEYHQHQPLHVNQPTLDDGFFGGTLRIAHMGM